MDFLLLYGRKSGERCKASDDEKMTSIYPNDMRTFIRLGRAEALLFVQHASDVLHSSNEL